MNHNGENDIVYFQINQVKTLFIVFDHAEMHAQLHSDYYQYNDCRLRLISVLLRDIYQ